MPFHKHLIISVLWSLSIDEPKYVSSQSHYKDGFEDILDERRHSSDIKYCIRKRRDVPKYKYCIPREPDDIKRHVLSSDRVQYVIEKVCN